MKIENRIKDLMLYYELSPADFSEALNINRSGLSHLFSGRNKASLELILKILNHFPEVSTDWLLHGKGLMFTQKPTEEAKTELISDTKEPLPDLFNQTEPVFLQNSEDLITENDRDPKHEDPSNRIAAQKPPIIEPQNHLKKENSILLSESENKPQALPEVLKIVFFYDNGKFEVFMP